MNVETVPPVSRLQEEYNHQRQQFYDWLIICKHTKQLITLLSCLNKHFFLSSINL